MRSDQHISEIIDSLDGVQRAMPKPFLHTRVMQKLQQHNSVWLRVGNFIARPAIAACCIIAVVGTNLYVTLDKEKNTPAASAEQPAEDNYTTAFNNNFSLAAIGD